MRGINSKCANVHRLAPVSLSFLLLSVRLNKLATLMSVNVADLVDTSLLLWSLYHGVSPVYCSQSAAADVRTIFSSRRRSITRPSKYFLTRTTKKILRAHRASVKFYPCPGHTRSKITHRTWKLREISNLIVYIADPVRTTYLRIVEQVEL